MARLPVLNAGFDWDYITARNRNPGPEAGPGVYETELTNQEQTVRVHAADRRGEFMQPVPVTLRLGMNFLAMIRGLCPRCGRGPIFVPGILGLIGVMNEVCPVCGLRFLRESGYFLGAMYVSYGLGVLTILPVSVVLAIVVEWPLWAVMVQIFGQTLISMALFFRLSRVIWLHVDQKVDPR
jgi:uncharacterized protein (DUF983 family)